MAHDTPAWSAADVKHAMRWCEKFGSLHGMLISLPMRTALATSLWFIIACLIGIVVWVVSGKILAASLVTLAIVACFIMAQLVLVPRRISRLTNELSSLPPMPAPPGKM